MDLTQDAKPKGLWSYSSCVGVSDVGLHSLTAGPGVVRGNINGDHIQRSEGSSKYK